METLRLVSQVPLGIFRKTLTKIELDKFVIPEETIIIPNLWKLHHDPLVYPDPFKFKPDRFLDKSGKLLNSCNENIKYLFPFGCGKRVCPGKNVAFNLIFLYVANLLKNFEFKLEKACDGDPRDFILKSNLEPREFKVLSSARTTTSVSSLTRRDENCKDLSFNRTSTNRRSDIKTLCSDKDALVKSIRENKQNFSDEENG